MKKDFFLIVCTLVFSLNAATLELSSKNTTFGAQHSPVGIQLFTLSNKLPTEEVYKRVTKKTDLDIYLRETEKHIVGYYGLGLSKNVLKKKLPFVKKYFPGAYIVHASWYHAKSSEELNKKQKISKYKISKIIAKANTLYHKGDELGTITQYEFLIASDINNPKIKNNLCYLYGRYGRWDNAKRIINNSYQSNLVYAYAYGSAETLQPNFYHDLKDYIMLDRSGHLALLAGYYFENKRELQKANKFYKMAYEKNRNDIYNIYAYARYLDIIGQKQEAVKLYREVYNRTDEANQLHRALRSRLY